MDTQGCIDFEQENDFLRNTLTMIGFNTKKKSSLKKSGKLDVRT